MTSPHHRERRCGLQYFFLAAILATFALLQVSFRKMGNGAKSFVLQERQHSSSTVQQHRVQSLSDDVEVKPVLSDDDGSSNSVGDTVAIVAFLQPTVVSVTPQQLSKWDPEQHNGYPVHLKLINSWGTSQSDELEYASYQIKDIKKPKRIEPSNQLLGVQKWASRGGASLNTEVRDINGIRGTVGNKPLKPGDTVLRIPANLIIYSNYNLWTPAGRRCKDAWSTPQESLVFFVLNDLTTNASSQFQEYYNVLPDDYSSHALHWNEDDLKMFSGSQFLKRRHHILNKTWHESYTNMKDCLKKDAANWTFGMWAWARTLVMSRNFNNGNLRALVPVGDMINHASSSESAKWSFDVKTRDFKLRATEHYRQGTPLYISYGKHTVKRFLLWYGFVDSDAQIGRRECTGEYAELLWTSKSSGDTITEVGFETINAWLGKLFADTASRLTRETVFTQWVVTLLRSRVLAEKKLSLFSTTLKEDHEIISRDGYSKRKTASQGTLQEKQILFFLMKVTDYSRVILSNPNAKVRDFFDDLQETLPVCTLVAAVEVLDYIQKAALT